jgi:hypothetical protein
MSLRLRIESNPSDPSRTQPNPSHLLQQDLVALTVSWTAVVSIPAPVAGRRIPPAGRAIIEDNLIATPGGPGRGLGLSGDLHRGRRC